MYKGHTHRKHDSPYSGSGHWTLENYLPHLPGNGGSPYIVPWALHAKENAGRLRAAMKKGIVFRRYHKYVKAVNVKTGNAGYAPSRYPEALAALYSGEKEGKDLNLFLMRLFTRRD